MTQPTPTEIINRFNHAFLNHDPTALDDLIAADCVMEAIQPAPDGARYEGREVGVLAVLGVVTAAFGFARGRNS